MPYKKSGAVVLECLCGERIELGIIGGQYQDSYYGKCSCGRKWSLEELTAALEEIEDC